MGAIGEIKDAKGLKRDLSPSDLSTKDQDSHFSAKWAETLRQVNAVSSLLACFGNNT